MALWRKISDSDAHILSHMRIGNLQTWVTLLKGALWDENQLQKVLEATPITHTPTTIPSSWPTQRFCGLLAAASPGLTVTEAPASTQRKLIETVIDNRRKRSQTTNG